MGTTRYFTGTASDDSRHNFVEEQAHAGGAPLYRLGRDGRYLKKVGEYEFIIVQSGLRIQTE